MASIFSYQKSYQNMFNGTGAKTWISHAGTPGSTVQAIEEKKFLARLAKGKGGGLNHDPSGIQIHTRADCAPCDKMRDWLKISGIPYKEINADDVDGRDMRGMEGIPQGVDFPLVFLNGQYVGGYKDALYNPEIMRMSVMGEGR